MIKGSKKENGKVHKLSFRATQEEKEMIMNQAKEKNMTMTEYLIYLVKKDK